MAHHALTPSRWVMSTPSPDPPARSTPLSPSSPPTSSTKRGPSPPSLTPRPNPAPSIGQARFLKTVRCRHRNGPLVIKIFIKHDPSVSLKAYHRKQKGAPLLSSMHPPTHPPTVDRDALQDIPNVYTSQAFVETDKAGYLIRQCIASNLYDRIRCVPLFPRRPLDPPSPKHPSISLRHRKEVDRLPAPHRSLPRPPPKDPSWRHQVHQRPRHLLKLDIPHRLCPLQANPSPPRRSLRLFIFLRHQWQAHLLRRSRALLQGRKRVQVHGPGRLQALSHRGDGRL